jgi:glucose-6-phosphate isomerase
MTPTTEAEVREPLNKRKAWKKLLKHYKKMDETHLRDLFADDPRRGERMTAEAVGIFLDYSKNIVTDDTLALLLRLADDQRDGKARRPARGSAGARRRVYPR